MSAARRPLCCVMSLPWLVGGKCELSHAAHSGVEHRRRVFWNGRGANGCFIGVCVCVCCGRIWLRHFRVRTAGVYHYAFSLCPAALLITDVALPLSLWVHLRLHLSHRLMNHSVPAPFFLLVLLVSLPSRCPLSSCKLRVFWSWKNLSK